MVKDKFYIFSDIETNSFNGNRILQIAAVAENKEEFNLYIDPKEDLPKPCRDLTGLNYYQKNLYRDGALLPTVSITKALTSFRDWLQHFQRPVTLVFHNGHGFDCPIIARHLLKLRISPPAGAVSVCDTLPGVRKHLRDDELQDHKLTTIAKYLEIPTEGAHDALQDSLILKTICNRIATKYSTSLNDLLKDSEKEFDYFIENEKQKLVKKIRKH